MSKTEQEKKRAKQLSDFRYWIRKYKILAAKQGVGITFIDNAAEILNDIYWVLMDTYVRPFVLSKKGSSDGTGKSNTNRFKIISTSEITVMKVSPVKVEKGVMTDSAHEEKERFQNAVFANFIAITILRSYYPEISKNSFKYISTYTENFENTHPHQIQSIQKEHIWWLAFLDTRVTLPILSNAITWRLYNLGLLTLEKLLALENKLPHETKTKQEKKRGAGRNSKQNRI